MTTPGFAVLRLTWSIPPIGASLAMLALVATAQAQTQEPKSPSEARVIVVGEGSINVPPDYAQISSGVTSMAKTVKEASDINSKSMAAITAVLLAAGIAEKDIQTSRFSIDPVYAPQPPPAEAKLSGYRVTNQVNVTVHPIENVGDILDRLVKAGATDVGNVRFLVSNPSKARDRAREAAVADARRKAELYAQALGFNLGRVTWITEGSDFELPVPLNALRASAVKAAPVPIERGENTLLARVTVGFDMAP